MGRPAARNVIGPARLAPLTHPDRHPKDKSHGQGEQAQRRLGRAGQGSGSGAMTELPDGVLPENMVLSNRDKAQHSDERGLDGKNVQTEQYQDHAGNRRSDDDQQAG